MDYLSSLKKSILHPTEFYSDLSKEEPKTLQALITLLLSCVVLVGAIFLGELLLGSDLIFNEFDLQTETYILQQLTTSQHFGFYIGSTQYVLIFFDKIFFLIKMFLIFIGVLYLTALLFREEKELNITKTFEITAWSSTIFLILGGITVIFLAVRFITPLYYHYIYYGIFIAFLVILLPSYLITGLGKSTSLSIYKRMIFVFSPMILFIMLWFWNHGDMLLGHML